MLSVTPAAPSGGYLSFAEREEIAILRAGGCGVWEIARRLGRSPSTISRELRRNAATRSGGLEYRASTAQWHADRRGRRPKPAKLAVNAELRRYVQDRLSGAVQRRDGVAVDGPDVTWIGRRHGRRKDRRVKSWSPEQIANRPSLDFPDDESMRVSHEAIYQSLYVRGRGALRRADRLPAHGQGAAGSESPDPAREELRDRPGSDQRASRPRRKTAPFPGTGRVI
jgi:IS30 family transposase